MRMNSFSFKLLVSSLAFFICFVSYSLYQNNVHNQDGVHTQEHTQEYTSDDVLNNYGFVEKEEQQALYNLLKLSPIFTQDKTEKEDIFPARETKDQLILDIVTLIDQTQKHFFIRTGNAERWEVKPVPWMNEHKEKTLAYMKILGFVDAVMPTKRPFGATCFFAGTAPRMSNRIELGNNLIKNDLNTGSILLLGGERYVTKNVDGSEEELAHIARELDVENWQQLTEMHLMQYIYGKSDIQSHGLPLYVIDTPARGLPRPTSVTTILELIPWLKDHTEVKSILFISSQPHVKYQKAVIDLIFKEQKVEIDYEVVGEAVVDVDNVQEMVGALGSYLWTISPIVLKAMQLQNSDQEVKDAFKRLYAHQPFMYQALPANLK